MFWRWGILREINERSKKMAVDLVKLQQDFNQFKTDVLTAIAALKASGLTAAQQAIVDQMDSDIQAADTQVKAG
jgi:hypothetical protein